MNMPVPGSPAPEIVTQESLLLGAAERVARIRDGRMALGRGVGADQVRHRVPPLSLAARSPLTDSGPQRSESGAYWTVTGVMRGRRGRR